MARNLRFFVILIILALCMGIPIPVNALGNHERRSESGNVFPENTLIIANEMDARFSRDFSVLLKHLRLEWVVIDSATVPDFINDKNLVLIGHPDAVYTGELMQKVLTPLRLTIPASGRSKNITLLVN